MRNVKGILANSSFVEVISVIVTLPAGSHELSASAVFARAGAPFLSPPGREQKKASSSSRIVLGRAVVNNPQPRAGSVIQAGKHDSSPRTLADLLRALLCRREARCRGTGATPRSSRIGRSLPLGVAAPDTFVTVALADEPSS